MSRFIKHPQLAALALVASAAVATPALADAVQPLPTGACGLSSARSAPGCRVARRHAIVRTAMADPRGMSFDDGRYGFAGGRSLNLLILGVGF